MVVFYVNWKTINSGKFSVHRKLQNPPTCLHRTNVASVNILLDLIYLSNLNGRLIKSLVNIFVDIFNNFERRTNLKVDMAVILGREIRIVWNDLAIVKGELLGIGESASIIRPGILWITILYKGGFRAELLGIMFATFSINHARGIRISWTTWTMHHNRGDSFVEERRGFRIRNLGRHQRIYTSRIMDLVIRMKEDENVSMRKATLLELYHID